MTGIYGELDPYLVSYEALYFDEVGVLCSTFVDHFQKYLLLRDYDVVSLKEI